MNNKNSNEKFKLKFLIIKFKLQITKNLKYF